MTKELCVRATTDLAIRPVEIEPAGEVLEGELMDNGCELALSRCTNTDLALMPDLYLSDVYDEHRTIRVCPNCAVDNSEAI